MPRIPTHQITDDWEDPDELNIEDDEPTDRLGRRKAKEDQQWEEHRREQLRKRHREE
jgi:hypothetical protein